MASSQIRNKTNSLAKAKSAKILLRRGDEMVYAPVKIWVGGEMVYAYALGAYGATRGGSTPLRPTLRPSSKVSV